jgi:hypothetical protein
MVTFFVIISVLLILNVALLIHSNMWAASRAGRTDKSITKEPAIKIYPIDLLTSGYKKAI